MNGLDEPQVIYIDVNGVDVSIRVHSPQHDRQYDRPVVFAVYRRRLESAQEFVFAGYDWTAHDEYRQSRAS